MNDQELDSRFQALPALDPPDAVVRETLRALAQERARSRWGRVAVLSGGMMAMAAALLVAVWAPAKEQPIVFEPRGTGEVLPLLEVKGAVREADGEVSRLRAGAQYRAGDTLLFRVNVSEPMELTLLREGKIIWTGRVDAGEHDLPVGYALEAGEAAAVFTVEGAGVAQELRVEAVAR